MKAERQTIMDVGDVRILTLASPPSNSLPPVVLASLLAAI